MTLAENFGRERKTIGVFVSRLGRVWDPEFIVGITDAAKARDLNVIAFVGGKPTAILTPGQMLPSYGLYDIARTEQLAGIIISGDLGYELGSREIKPFIANYSHLPMIVNALQVDGIPNLIGDNLRGMRTAISHLYDTHGYKRIAFIRGPENHVEAEQRFLAYKQELKARQIVYNENLVLQGDFSVESGRAAIHTMLDDRNLKVDAIVGANDRMAIGAFEALQLRGIQVPGQIALIGFDDIREARSMGVPLTTTLQSYYDMGKQAVELLLRRIDGEALPENIILPTQLVVRWSCGCLPGSAQKINSRRERAFQSDQAVVTRDAAILTFLNMVGASSESPQVVSLKSAGYQVWDCLLTSLRDEKQSNEFLRSIEALISALTQYSDDSAVWHGVISTLRQYALKTINERAMLLQADDLFQQAHIMVGELFQRHQALQRLRIDLQEEVLQAFSFSMAPAMNLEDIGAAVERHFPLMGIERMYVMLYASMTMPQSTLVPPSDNYYLLMKYDEAGIQIPVDQPKWAVGHMIPSDKALESQRYAAIVMPLILAQNRFGFLWIEMKSRDWEVYVRVRNLISSALLRTMLVDQRTLMQKQVEHLLQESQLREMELAIATETAERTAEENATLYAHEQERRKGAEVLSKVSRNLSSLLKLDEMPHQILLQLAQLLPYERAALLIEEPGGTTRILAQIGFPDDRAEDDLLAQIDSSGAYARIVQSGDAVLINDVTESTQWEPVDWLTINHSWAGVPLLSKDKVIGMLMITRQAAAAFSHDDLLLVTTFGMQTAVSLENARLYDEVTRFNEILEGLVAQRVEELNIAYSKLEKLDKNKTSFIQVTAHELRTPLTVMKGYLGMIKGIPAIQANESLSLAVDGVMKGTDRLHTIVNSMLDVAKLEGQTITPHMETVIIAFILQLVQKEYKSDMTARNITLIYEEGINSLPFIQADPELLQKALDAIIVNAIKYTPDGGSISLGGRVIEDDQLGSCLEIHVRDTGIGIDPANHHVIFEKLFQLGKVELHSSGRTKFKGGGPGLGLAIAAGIVKAHNGKIWVESLGSDEEKFPGSTFFIRLPLSSKA